MKTLLTALFVLFYLSASAQLDSAAISINFKKQSGEIVLLQHGGVTQSIALNSKGQYKGKVPVVAGDYTLVNRGDEQHIRLEPGIELKVSTVTKQGKVAYIFSVKKSAENKFLNQLAIEQAKYLPLKDNVLTDDVNFIEPADFLTRLDQYKTQSLKLLAAQSLNGSFTDMEKAYIDFLTRKYALQYMHDYGVNTEKKKEYLKNLVNGDPGLDTPEGKQAALNAVYTKALTYDDRRAVFARVYNGFDANNEVLYKHSADYVDFVDEMIGYLAKTGGNTDVSFAERRIDFIKSTITNPYIREQLLKMYNGS